MTTTDIDALTERIGRILNDEGWTFEGVHEPGEYDECEECRLTVDPIAARVAREVAVEVRKAKAEAWQEGVNFALPGKETYWISKHNPHRAIETGDSDERRRH